MGETIKKLYFEVVVEAAIASSIAALPFLGVPVIKQIYTFLVKHFAGNLFEEGEVYGLFYDIDSEVDEETTEYQEATDTLRTELERDDLTEEEKQRAKDEYKEKLRNLIMLNRS